MKGTIAHCVPAARGTDFAVRIPGTARPGIPATVSRRALGAATRFLQDALSEARRAQAGSAELPELVGILRQVTDAIMVAESVVVTDKYGFVACANERFCRVLGRSRVGLAGLPAKELLGDHAARVLVEVMPRGSRRRAECRELELIDGDGRTLFMHASIYRLEDSHDRFLGCFIVLSDLTARKRAEAALEQSESDLRLLSAQLLCAQELERRRIASELHDGIGQAIGSLRYELQHCAERLQAGEPANPLVTLRSASERALVICDELRRIAMNLRPSTLDDLGILPTLGWFCRETRTMYAHIKVSMIVDVAEDEIADGLKTTIYRIVQEAFANVISHSGASTISLSLISDGGEIRLRIADNGKGFDSARGAKPNDVSRGMGLASMRQRVEFCGGRFRLHSAPGGGTKIIAAWPIVPASEREAAHNTW